MIHWIFQDEACTQQYHQYFADFLTYFSSGEFAAEFDRVVEMIAPYVEKDPTAFCTYEEFRTGVDTLREFCLLRAESILGQLAGEDTQVDASHLTISAMGSMGNMGGGMGGPGGQMPNVQEEVPEESGDQIPQGKMPEGPPEGWSGGPPSFG